MDNIFDYIDNYGNDSFQEKEFNEIDNIIFSSLIYVDYSKKIINGNKHTLEEIGNYYLKSKRKLNKDELLLKKL